MQPQAYIFINAVSKQPTEALLKIFEKAKNAESDLSDEEWEEFTNLRSCQERCGNGLRLRLKYNFIFAASKPKSGCIIV